MARPPRHGLRAAILLALSAAVAIAFSLLDLVVVRLGERARADERLEAAEATAALLAEVASSPWMDASRLDVLADSTIGRGGVVAVEVMRHGQTIFARGSASHGRRVDARGRQGLVASVYVDPDDGHVGRRQSRFLLLYILLTAGGILVLMYASLTGLVIRPLERLRKASERLAAGNLAVTVPTEATRELAELAEAFNTIGRALAADREALVARLAELERTTAELRTAQDQVVRNEKLASVGRLAAGLAHEVGNPLAAILGLVELLEGGDLPEDEAREFIVRVRAETERIHRILRELLDFARPQADADEGRASADVRAVAEQVVGLVRPQRTFRNVTLRNDAGPLRVAMAESRLHQVLLNLALNAGDAVGGQGEVRIATEEDGAHVRVLVEDDGTGIDPTIMPRLFEPFVTTKAEGRGTGLGLAVCHTLVDRAGGRIEVEGREPRGTRFVLVLPRAKG